ncbi:unnamed protein product, partial [Prorocentrum cordatum]
ENAGYAALANFIVQMFKDGLITIRDERAASVGIFLAAKTGGRLRKILDTRAVNDLFEEPARSRLPASASWASVEIGIADDLVLSQMDVGNVPYRCKALPGVSGYFALRRVPAKHLHRADPKQSGHRGLPASGCVAPRLEVMAMAWSLALYFCCVAVTAGALRAVPGEAFLLDKKQAPDITGDKFGVAIYAGSAGSSARTTAQFTGMTLDWASGRISVGAEVCAALRSAVDSLARASSRAEAALEFDDGRWRPSSCIHPPGSSVDWRCWVDDGEFEDADSDSSIAETDIQDEARQARSFVRYFFLEVNKVTRPSALMCDRYFRDFQTWASDDCLPLNSSEDISTAMPEYLGVLDRAEIAPKGFRGLAPGLSRAPLPSIELCALVGAALRTDELKLAWCLVFLFHAYLRPSERHEFDVSLLLLDGRGLVHLCPRFSTLKKRSSRGMAWSFDSRTFSSQFKRVAELAGLGRANLHPCTMRCEKRARVQTSRGCSPEPARDYGRAIGSELQGLLLLK